MQQMETNARLLCLMFLMLVAGACNVLLKEFMVNVEAPTAPTIAPSGFNRPILWSMLMKAGMALCLPFQCQWPRAPIYVFFISCALGFFVDMLVNMAYCDIAGSAIQMLRGGKVVLTAVLSVSVLGRRLHFYQVVGGAIVVLGISMVGFSTSPSSSVVQPQSLAQMPWKAIGFCITGEICQAVLWVYQESVLRKYDVPPLQLVGLEGLIGIALGSIVLAAAHPLGIESVTDSFHQLCHSVPLLVSVASLLVSMAFFNFSGVGVTKLGSAIHRSIIDVARSVIIWVVEISVGWHTFRFSQLCGFATLVFGALIYNHLLVIPQFESDAEELPIIEKKREATQA